MPLRTPPPRGKLNRRLPNESQPRRKDRSLPHEPALFASNQANQVRLAWRHGAFDSGTLTGHLARQESLSEGVPLVCIPLGNDQPGVAARVKAHGAGVVVPPRRVNAERLRAAVRSILENDSYRLAARKIQSTIAEVDGLNCAADIIEDVLKIGKQTSR